MDARIAFMARRRPLAAVLAAAWIFLGLGGSGCSIHLAYEKGELHSETVLREWETDKSADLRIGIGGADGAGIAIDVSGSRTIHQEVERKFRKMDVRESFNPLLEFIEIPLAAVLPAVSGAVVVPLWFVASALYGFVLQGCVEHKIFDPLEKLVDGDPAAVKDAEFRFGEFLLGLLFDFTGIGVPLMYLPCSIGAGAKIVGAVPVGDAIIWFPVLVFGREGAGKAIDPTRNYFSSVSKTDTGEFFTERSVRERNESGPLKERDLDVVILGRQFRARTDAQGKALLEGRTREDSGFRGMRRSAQLVLKASADGFATLNGGTLTASPGDLLPVLSVLDGSDWTPGESGSKPDVVVQVGADNPDGQRAVVRISARNAGSETIYRTHAVIHSRTRAFDDWITTFGALKPGETRVRIVEMPIAPKESRLPHTLLVEMLGPRGRLAEFVEAEIPAR